MRPGGTVAEHSLVYPAQEQGWHPVSPAKLGAWYLLMYISFVLVAAVHSAQEPEPGPAV